MDHVSKKDAAKILGLGLSTLDRWHANGYGPYRYLYGGRVKYGRAELLRFLKQVSEEAGIDEQHERVDRPAVGKSSPSPACEFS